ncbi:uncharacterized protein METZ01_LOCUS496294 [marine metagenome]|uniref:Uncharacterized protein n=1 Tax=marine metagenome TaxID=408172 RepID=A0A383DGJ8_9ZZZZ
MDESVKLLLFAKWSPIGTKTLVCHTFYTQLEISTLLANTFWDYA